LEDLWNAVTIDKTVYFRSKNKIYSVQDTLITVFNPQSVITFMQSVDDTLIYNQLDKGLYKLIDGKENFIEGSEVLANIPIIDIISIEPSNYLVLTERNGVYQFKDGSYGKWNSNAESYFLKNRISSGYRLNNSNDIAIGTLLGGLVILDSNGSAKSKIDNTKGLQNNTISCITADGTGNLWLGTYNGIDKININSNSSLFFPDGELKGALYDIALWHEYLYFATTNGLYRIKHHTYYDPFLPKDFTLITNTQGQAWGLDIIDDNLFLAHNDGGFLINKDGTASKISKDPGVWKFQKVSDNHLILGTYSGLELYAKEGNSYNYVKHLEGFEESSRILVQDKFKNLWVSHPYKGVFKINYNNQNQTISVAKVQQNQGIDNLKNCYATLIDGELFITNEEGAYTYVKEQDNFFKEPLINSLFEDQQLKRLIQQPDNTLWYISDKDAGIIRKTKSGFDVTLEKEIVTTSKNKFVGGFENLFPISDEEVLICSNKGVIYKHKQHPSQHTNKVAINAIHLIKNGSDSIVQNRFQESSELKLKAKENNLIFTYSSNHISKQKDFIQYSYMLEGFDENWSNWEGNSSKEYTNIPSGKFIFHVRSLTPFSPEISEATVEFTIQRPWYASLLMLSIYALVFILALSAMIIYPKKKYTKEKEIILELKKETEAEVVDLKNEKLQSEIDFKNKELATATMHLLQKSETLKQIEAEVDKISLLIKDPQAKKELRKMISILNSDIRLEDDWQNFSFHFDQVHHNFIARIKEDYPVLSPTDLKLCAYLRLNLTTKEIAPLLNISPRGVEISRYRLRKKLNLDGDVNLNTFMIGY
jgi:DNA-binding CsgD family transcriptional regulator